MLFVTIVLDGVGIGAQPDAGQYGDEDSNTLLHVCERARPNLPNLTRLGLGCILPMPGVPPVAAPLASYGRMQEVSAGKDSTTGHWELAGLVLEHPFPTYPDGFPPEVIGAFIEQTGCGGLLGNVPASGTTIVDELGEEHQKTGFPIVYTSADSVFQVAAHVETIPLDHLYRICRIARDEVCTGEHAVGRVIARPFEGVPGSYIRRSAARKDFALPPPSPTLQEALQANGILTVTVGKIGDLFAGVGFDQVHKTRSNEEGIEQTLQQMRVLGASGGHAFLWTNLVDFDQEYGHRNDVDGFARALEVFDRAVPDLLNLLPSDGRLIITADHGNDPTTPGTDHSREYVPILYYDSGRGTDLGLRTSFNDHAATLAAFFSVPFATQGAPFDLTSRRKR
ncbi:MAG TPA: phosphopentomutase [Rhodothermales bacterium]|nr:phosphopentomutase [Rhodothermales bacterium]